MNVKRMTSMGWTAESEAIRRRSDRTLRYAMERRGLGVGVGKEGAEPERWDDADRIGGLKVELG